MKIMATYGGEKVRKVAKTIQNIGIHDICNNKNMKLGKVTFMDRPLNMSATWWLSMGDKN